MDTEFEIRNIKLRLEILEQHFWDLNFSPSELEENNNRKLINKIKERCGHFLIEKTWAQRNNPESLKASYEIAFAFFYAWEKKQDQAEIQYLISIVAKALNVESMPSYTAIMDWIKAFTAFSIEEVKLIGKSAAIKLAKADASKELRDYVVMAAKNDDVFSIPKILELIERENSKGSIHENS